MKLAKYLDHVLMIKDTFQQKKFIRWLIFIKIVLQVVKRLKKIIIKKIVKRLKKIVIKKIVKRTKKIVIKMKRLKNVIKKIVKRFQVSNRMNSVVM